MILSAVGYLAVLLWLRLGDIVVTHLPLDRSWVLVMRRLGLLCFRLFALKYVRALLYLLCSLSFLRKGQLVLETCREPLRQQLRRLIFSLLKNLVSLRRKLISSKCALVDLRLLRSHLISLLEKMMLLERR